MPEQTVYLYPGYFEEKEREVLANGKLRASVFRYASGVEAIRLCNEKGGLIVLPYQGAQIWRLDFLGHAATMHSEFDEPVRTRDFFENYGMFMLHCGLTAMGNPTKEDTHPQHGELPFARFGKAWLLSGADGAGRYVAVAASYRHARAFTADYTFTATYKLYEDASTILTTVSFTNSRPSPLEYFYMCHINYLPVDGSRLVYSARHADITPHYDLSPGLTAERAAQYNAFFDALVKDPSIQDVVDGKTQVYDPEICSTIRYQHDENGHAHALQVMPDGQSCYVRFEPEVLPIGLRWIARTGVEEAMGIVLPATAEHLGYTHCKQHHYERYLACDDTVTYEIEVGVLDRERTAEVENTIKRILG